MKDTQFGELEKSKVLSNSTYYRFAIYKRMRNCTVGKYNPDVWDPFVRGWCSHLDCYTGKNKLLQPMAPPDVHF